MIKRQLTNSYYLILGLVLILFAVLIFIQPIFFWNGMFQILGLLLLFRGIKATLQFLITKEKNQILSILYFLSCGSLLLFLPNIPLHLFLLIFALYVGGLGIIKFMTYFQNKKSQKKRTCFFLFISLFLLAVSLSLFFGNQMTIKSTSLFLGLYSLSLGCMYIIDWLQLFISFAHQEKIKRRLRISPPIWILALIPRFLLEQLQEDPIDPIDTMDSKTFTGIQILIHVTTDGFGAIGHCDVVIDGCVFSYGNYDDLSATLFESLGDGVLVMANVEKYIPFCIKNNQKTIFLYTLQLTKEQEQTIRQAARDFKQIIEPWQPSNYILPHKEGYAQKLTQQIEASLFKFKQGPFKNYFVLGCNCVELVDWLVGPAGIDLIGVNGIVSPGTYQAYLEKEYHFKQGIVSKRTIYRFEEE